MGRTDLLKPQRRVFTKGKRRYGPFSVLLGLITAAVMTVVWSAYVGRLLPDDRLMLAVGLVAAVIVPFVVAWKVHAAGPRVFALIDTVAVVLVFVVLGGPTNRALADHGVAPFEAVAHLFGGARHDGALSDLGTGVVHVLRSLTLGKGAPAKHPVAPPAAARPKPHAAAEPTASAAPAPKTTRPAAAGAAHKEAAIAPAVQAAVEDAGDEGGGTFNVVPSAHESDGIVEVPISTSGRSVTVGALVNGKVPADFTFDTGADYTAITPVLARRLGFDPAHLRVRRKFLTAGGPIDDPVVRLGSLAIDDATVKGLEVVVCTRCPRNLLGRDFQSHFKVEIDSKAGILRLTPR